MHLYLCIDGLVDWRRPAPDRRGRREGVRSGRETPRGLARPRWRAVSGFAPTRVSGFAPTQVSGFAPTQVSGFAPTLVSSRARLARVA